MTEGIARLAPLDLGVIAVYALGIIALGLWATKRKSTAQDFFLASRESRWPVIGLSLLASNISSTTLIGLAGAAYSVGISVYNYEWMAGVVLVIFCAFVLPAILRSQVYTMPEFLERRYDGFARSYFTGLTLFLNIVVDTAGTLYGGSMMFKLLFPDAPLTLIVAALALAAGTYTVAGGLRAVLYTETVQAIILLGSSMAIAFFAFAKAGGWDVVMNNIDPAKLSLIRPLDDPGVPWLGIVTGVSILGFYFWCTNQFMVQRVLSAKSLDHGRWGSLFAGLLKLPVLYFMVLPGSVAILLYPTLDRPDLVYPTLLFDLLPVGIVGLVVAGFLAAIMSASASTFNSAATLFTMDVVRRWKPDTDSRDLVFWGRISTLTFMALAILWAPQIGRFGSLFQYLQAILSYAVPPIAALFAGGLLWRRANARGARWTIIIGFLSGAALFVLNAVLGLISIHFLYVAAILLLISIATLIVASLTAPAPDSSKTEGIVWTPAIWHAESATLRALPFWQNYRTQSAGLLLLTAAIVWTFR
ncbi:sodium transporter [Sphingomonas oleivorans]|uniref:Sodium transporter n=1 Tax=Sphingomonas oleivorans TaxID=1735121 RepID=A0A2T5G0N9_9SPHN|nr:sodium:solute symporter [Sphingomonas oleivorans]PTQ12680.1 sodium transporter [Sphingomonas oleivorans]